MPRDKHTPIDRQADAWRDRLGALEREPEASLWERIAADLPPAPARRRWRFWPAASVAAALVGLVVGLNLRPVSQAPDQAAPETQVQAAVAGSLAEVASPAVHHPPASPQLDAHPLPPLVLALEPGGRLEPGGGAEDQPTPVRRYTRPESLLQPVPSAEIGPLHPYEQGLQLFATANYCQSHVHLNEARKHVCAREPLEQINQLLSYIESRVSSECLCLAYEEAGH